MSKKVILSVLAAAGVGLAAIPLAAQSSGMAVLDKLERGQWELRERGSKATRRICVRTGRELIQLRHRGPDCSRYVVESGTDQVTVQYTCRGNGYARTSIRREPPTLVQIESQGIADELPFEFIAEARRVGSCR